MTASGFRLGRRLAATSIAIHGCTNHATLDNQSDPATLLAPEHAEMRFRHRPPAADRRVGPAFPTAASEAVTPRRHQNPRSHGYAKTRTRKNKDSTTANPGGPSLLGMDVTMSTTIVSTYHCRKRARGCGRRTTWRRTSPARVSGPTVSEVSQRPRAGSIPPLGRRRDPRSYHRCHVRPRNRGPTVRPGSGAQPDSPGSRLPVWVELTSDMRAGYWIPHAPQHPGRLKIAWGFRCGFSQPFRPTSTTVARRRTKIARWPVAGSGLPPCAGGGRVVSAAGETAVRGDFVANVGELFLARRLLRHPGPSRSCWSRATARQGVCWRSCQSQSSALRSPMV